MAPMLLKQIAKNRCCERILPTEIQGQAGNCLKEALRIRSKGQSGDSGQQALQG